MPLQQLPLDVYIHILSQIPVSASSDDGPKTLITCSEVNTTLRVAASLPSVWEPHYRAKYTICDPARETYRKLVLGNDWKAHFLSRLRIDKQAIIAIDLLVAERAGRPELARRASAILSFDGWNALEAETRCNPPEPLELDESTNREPCSDILCHALPRRYWAQCLLGAISRSHAIKAWGAIKSNPEDQPESLELAIACLSSFFVYPPTKIIRQLENLAHECRAYLVRNHISVNPDEFNYSKRQLERISVAICDFMWEKGFRPADQTLTGFHNLNTRFPHWFLSTHKDTIPISLVYIYVCIARRLSILAAPINFPDRVLAVISSPDSKVPNIFLDVYGSQSRPLLSIDQDIPRLLTCAGLRPEFMVRYLQPASTTSMILRAAGNVLTSFSLLPQLNSTVREADSYAALYSALVANLVFMNDPRFLSNFIYRVNQFPLDSLVVLQDALAPILDQPIRSHLIECCHRLREAERQETQSTILRLGLLSPPKYFVGLVFRHAKYNYIGYVYGWDPVCDASDDWIESMVVDSLSRGRQQPFYHTFADVGSIRYVAEENIVPATVRRDEYLQLFEQVPEAGRYFEGLVQRQDRARLVLSSELRARYPEDNAFADEWIMAV
ncbi:YccV-like-domain-containing protein [Scleroderma citrinum]